MEILREALLYGSISNLRELPTSELGDLRLRLLAQHCRNNQVFRTGCWNYRIFHQYFIILQSLRSETSAAVLQLHTVDNGSHALIAILRARTRRQSELSVEESYDCRLLSDLMCGMYLSRCRDPVFSQAVKKLLPDWNERSASLDYIQAFRVIRCELDVDLESSSHPRIASGPESDTMVRIRCLTNSIRLSDSPLERRVYLNLLLQLDYISALVVYLGDNQIDLVSRITELRSLSQHYWNVVAPQYLKLVETDKLDFNTLRQLAVTPVAQHLRCPKPWEPEDFQWLTPEMWSISRLHPGLAAYILGLPLQIGVPGPRIICQSLRLLHRLGVSQYARHLCIQGSQLVCPVHVRQLIEPEQEIEIDLNGVPFEDYGPFDRVGYIYGDHYTEFTRPAFETLLKYQTNPYNRMSLLNSELIPQMQLRQNLARWYSLPEATPLQTLLERYLTPIPSPEFPPQGVAPLCHALTENPISMISGFVGLPCDSALSAKGLVEADIGGADDPVSGVGPVPPNGA